jgi:hypothetical protein
MQMKTSISAAEEESKRMRLSGTSFRPAVGFRKKLIGTMTMTVMMIKR